jgi:hypothetical protein
VKKSKTTTRIWKFLERFWWVAAIVVAIAILGGGGYAIWYHTNNWSPNVLNAKDLADFITTKGGYLPNVEVYGNRLPGRKNGKDIKLSACTMRVAGKEVDFNAGFYVVYTSPSWISSTKNCSSFKAVQFVGRGDLHAYPYVNGNGQDATMFVLGPLDVAKITANWAFFNQAITERPQGFLALPKLPAGDTPIQQMLTMCRYDDGSIKELLGMCVPFGSAIALPTGTPIGGGWYVTLRPRVPITADLELNTQLTGLGTVVYAGVNNKTDEGNTFFPKGGAIKIVVSYYNRSATKREYGLLILPPGSEIVNRMTGYVIREGLSFGTYPFGPGKLEGDNADVVAFN